MADAFFIPNGQTRAVTSIRRAANGQPQLLSISIPDGDTIGVHVAGSGSVRFLGIDTPEKSFELPGQGTRRLDSNVILHPQSYFHIPNPEDRLFIPPAFVPLFVTRGWRLEGWF